MTIALQVAFQVLSFLFAHRSQIDEMIQYAEKELAGNEKGAKLAYVLGNIHAIFAVEKTFEASPFEPIAPFILGHIDSRVKALFPKDPVKAPGKLQLVPKVAA